MGISLKSPAGYGPNAAVLQSQVLTEFPTNYALSFWLGGNISVNKLLQSSIQQQIGRNSGIGLFNTWNIAPLLWFGDPAPNVIDSQQMDPTLRTRYAPNWSWAFFMRYTQGGASPSPSIGITYPYSDEPKKGLLYNDFPTDLQYEASHQVGTRNPTGVGGWDTGRPNHVFISVTRVPLWYDWGTQYVLAINGIIQRVQTTRRVPIRNSGDKRICIGCPALPLEASDELILEDFRIFELPADVPPYDGSTGPSWDFRNAVSWAIPQELAYSRGRDRLGYNIFAHVPLLNLAAGTTFPNGSTFKDTTGRLTFTVVQSGNFIVQAPLTSPTTRPIIGRGRNFSGSNVQVMDVTFRGRMTSHNEEFDYEGSWVDSTQARTYMESTLFGSGQVEVSGNRNPPQRQDAIAHFPAAFIEDGS